MVQQIVGLSSRIDRRDMVSVAAFFTAADLAMAYIAKQLRTQQNPNSFKEHYLCKYPAGYIVGGIFGVHGVLNNNNEIDQSKVTNINPKDLYEPIGALLVDGMPSLGANAGAELYFQLCEIYQNVNAAYFGQIYAYCKSYNIPIIFGDMFYNLKVFADMNKAGQEKSELWMQGTSVVALATALTKLTHKLLDKRVWRRDFYNTVLVVSAAHMAYLTSDNNMLLMRSLGIKPDTQVARDFQTISSYLIHPNNYLIVLRTMIWAFKILDMFQTGLLKKNEICNVLAGSAHQFLDFFVRYPDIALKYWKLCDYSAVCLEIYEGGAQWVYNSQLYYPRDMAIVPVVHNSLKKLLS